MIPGGAQREQAVRKRERPAVVGRLDEQVARVAAEAEPPELLERQPREPLDCDLAAAPHLELDSGPVQLVAQLLDAVLHHPCIGRPVVADVRRAGDHGDAVGNGRAGDLEAVLQRAGSVVDAAENVRVKIDHPARTTMSA